MTIHTEEGKAEQGEADGAQYLNGANRQEKGKRPAAPKSTPISLLFREEKSERDDKKPLNPFDILSLFDKLFTSSKELVFLGNMSRSLKKGPYVDGKLLKKVEGKKPGDIKGAVKTWARRSQISPEMVGFTFGVHNGKEHIDVFVTEEMVGHRFGEFSITKKFLRHGGKMQKELEQKKKENEIAAAKAAKEVTETKK